MITRVAGNFMMLLAAECVAKVISFFVYLILIRALGATEYGKYTFAMAFAGIFLWAFDFGITAIVAREVARDYSNIRAHLWNALVVKGVLSILQFILAPIVVFLLSGSTDKTLLVAMMSGALVIGHAGYFLRTVFFQARERMGVIGIFRIAETVALLVSVVAVVLMSYHTALPIVASVVCANVAILLLHLYVLWRKVVFPTPGLSWGGIWFLLRESWPIALANTSFYLYIQFDTIMLERLRGDAEVGWYNAAYQLIIAFFAISYIFATALQPVFARLYITAREQLREIFNRSILFLVALGLPIATSLFVLAPRIVLLLYGPSFFPAVSALQILSGVLVFTFVNVAFTTLFISIGQQRLSFAMNGIGLFVNVVFNLFFIPLYGIDGAAAATLIAEIAMAAIGFAGLSKVYYRFPLFRIVWRPTVATAACTVPLYIFRDTNLVFLFGVGIVSAVGTNLFFRTFSKDDALLLYGEVKTALQGRASVAHPEG